MATRSRIGIVNPDNTVTSIYCHFDGYPSHVGAVLLEHYNTPDRVAALMALGDLSALYPKLAPEPGQPHHVDRKRAEGVTLAYGRDRGETGIDAKVTDTAEYVRTAEEYGYLFAPGVGWTYSDHGRAFVPLTPAAWAATDEDTD